MSDPNAPDPPEPSADEPRPLVPYETERAVGALAMALICVISFANVVVRYATDVSFAFTEEWSVFLLVVMTFVGASAAFARGTHIRISFFVDKLPAPLRALSETVVVAASLFMFALLVYYGAQLTWDQYQFDTTSPGLGYPTWIYTMWMPLLALAGMARIVGRAIRRVRGRR